MIGYLAGRLLENLNSTWIVGVGRPQSIIGYSVAIPESQAYLGRSAGEQVELFIHTHVRESAIELFGFVTQEERQVFLLLQKVEGIGPKGALAILSFAGTQSLLGWIASADTAALMELPGVGKKKADRMVVELTELAKKRMELQGAISQVASGRSDRANESRELSEAREALQSLGYREADVTQVLKRVGAELVGKKTEDWIRRGLKELN